MPDQPRPARDRPSAPTKDPRRPAYRIYRCPVDGHLYAAVFGWSVHPGLAAVHRYATRPNPFIRNKRRSLWGRVWRAMAQYATAAELAALTEEPYQLPLGLIEE